MFEIQRNAAPARARSTSSQPEPVGARSTRRHELSVRARNTSSHELAARASSSPASTSSQHEPSRHELAARASSSRATSELEHGTRLAPLFASHAPLSAPLPHHRTADGALAALSGSSVQFHTRRQKESSSNCTPRGTTYYRPINHYSFSSRNVFQF